MSLTILRSKRSVHMPISLAFVAPDIIEALIAGQLPEASREVRTVSAIGALEIREKFWLAPRQSDESPCFKGSYRPRLSRAGIHAMRSRGSVATIHLHTELNTQSKTTP